MKTIKCGLSDVKRINAGRGTLVRPAKIAGKARFSGCDDAEAFVMKGEMPVPAKCPYGNIGDILQVVGGSEIEQLFMPNDLYIKIIRLDTVEDEGCTAKKPKYKWHIGYAIEDRKTMILQHNDKVIARLAKMPDREDAKKLISEFMDGDMTSDELLNKLGYERE